MKEIFTAFILLMLCVASVIIVVNYIRADAERSKRFKAAQAEYDEMKCRIRKELEYGSK